MSSKKSLHVSYRITTLRTEIKFQYKLTDFFSALTDFFFSSNGYFKKPVEIKSMGLADLFGFANLHCRKVESTKWLKHKLRATIGGQ